MVRWIQIQLIFSSNFFFPIINILKIVKTSICKIPPALPLLAFGREKILREEFPLFGKEGEGRFSNDYVNSILRISI
jgi:hypothetical protein